MTTPVAMGTTLSGEQQASVAYNVVEAIIAIGAGLVAGSVALVGFRPGLHHGGLQP
jgi:hypothetical protein